MLSSSEYDVSLPKNKQGDIVPLTFASLGDIVPLTFEIKTIHEQNHTEEKLVINSAHGKPYTFLADSFLNEDEINSFELSPDAIFLGQDNIAPSHVVNRGKQLSLETKDEPF